MANMNINYQEQAERLGISVEEYMDFIAYMDIEEMEAYTEDEIADMYNEYCEIYDIPNEQNRIDCTDYLCYESRGW